jgi:formate dehydrogenase subunit gamma
MTPARVPVRVARFDRTERIVHWCSATLFLVLVATGAALYAGPISTLVGRRDLMRNVHVYAGLLLPVPVLLGLVLHSGARLRADLARLSRWDSRDRGWWRRSRRAGVQLGKFNPGQKLNAAFIGAGIVVMLATGSIMRWFEPFPDDWRTGATFVHDWFAFGLGLAIIGHVVLAFADPDALRGMVRGWVPGAWAAEKRPRWYAEASADSDPSAGDPAGDVVARTR